MCFRKCQQCQAELNQADAETHNCDWTHTFRPWQTLETVQGDAGVQVKLEYLAAEIDMLRQAQNRDSA